MFEIAEGHFLVGTHVGFLVVKLGKDVVVVLIKELLNLEILLFSSHMCDFWSFWVLGDDCAEEIRMFNAFKDTSELVNIEFNGSRWTS